MSQTITLTVADLAAMMSAAVCAGIRRAVGGDPSTEAAEIEWEADAYLRAKLADPTFVTASIDEFLESFERANQARDAWVELAARTIDVTLRGRAADDAKRRALAFAEWVGPAPTSLLACSDRHPVDTASNCVSCGHPAVGHVSDDEERRECVACDCKQYVVGLHNADLALFAAARERDDLETDAIRKAEDLDEIETEARKHDTEGDHVDGVPLAVAVMRMQASALKAQVIQRVALFAERVALRAQLAKAEDVIAAARDNGMQTIALVEAIAAYDGAKGGAK